MTGPDRIALTPATLKGIAHPVRVRLLTLLREHGPSTATKLAQRIDQSSGVTSYHLRQLALHGFVEEDTGRGTGRERWWRARHRSTQLDAENARQAPIEAEAYLRSIGALYADRMDRWISELADEPREWDESGTLSDRRLRLTAAESATLIRDIERLLDSYRADPPDEAPADAARVIVQFQVMPFPSTADEPGDAR
jgi:DNA-binding transcriptional ArsR family regulator